MLKDNRNWFVCMLLTFITFGLYGIYLVHVMARDTNIACSEDGKHTRGFLALMFFSIITFGIYAIVWQCAIIKRWMIKAESCGENPKCTRLDWILWNVILSFSLLGPLVFQWKYMNGFNQVCRLYNSKPSTTTHSYSSSQSVNYAI